MHVIVTQATNCQATPKSVIVCASKITLLSPEDLDSYGSPLVSGGDFFFFTAATYIHADTIKKKMSIKVLLLLPYRPTDIEATINRLVILPLFRACWLFLCFRNPPNSDRDHRIRDHSYACVYT